MKLRHGLSLFIIGVLIIYTEAAVREKRQNSQQCGKHEEYLPCGPSCQTECPTLNQPCLIAHFRCPDGCYCKKNFARETIGGRCIPISQCKK